jgi:tetratricopeptide (TPR) repeat protein
VSLWMIVSAFIFVCPAIGFGQTAGWEKQRQLVVEMRRDGRLHEAFETTGKMVAAAERNEAGAAPLALVLHDYGIISADLTLYADAEKALKRAIRLMETAQTRNDPVIQAFRLRLAEVYVDAGRYKEGRALFAELEPELEQTQPGSVELAVALDQLAWLEVLRRNFVPAEALLRRSLRILEARTDVSPYRMADTLNDYASLLFSMKRYADAAPYCERAQALLERQGGRTSATLINTWTLLGAAYSYSGRTQEAEAYVRRAIAGAQSIYGEDNRRAGRLMIVAAALLQRCGEKAEAKSLRKKADQILAKANGEDPGRFTIDVNALR